MCSRYTLDFDSRRSERRQLNQRGFDGSRASSFHSNSLSRTSEPDDPACLPSCINRSPNSGSTVISNKSQYNESAQPREATNCSSSRYLTCTVLVKERARGSTSRTNQVIQQKIGTFYRPTNLQPYISRKYFALESATSRKNISYGKSSTTLHRK